MPRPSAALFISVMAPCRLFCMVPAIVDAAPSQFSRASSYPAILDTPSARIIFRPPTDRDVNVADSAADRSAVPMPSVAASTSSMMSVRSRKFPFASVTATAVSPIWIFPSSIFAVISRIMADSFVPASEPLIPWFANASRKDVVVFMSCPAAFMLAAQFPNASPSCAVVVLLLAWAYAIMSAISPARLASMPKADR